MCPLCSRAKAHRYTEALHAIWNGWRERGDGHGGVMVTLTVAHGPAGALKPMMRSMQKVWERVTAGVGWQKLGSKFHVYTQVRATEQTHGYNGWHPHLHVLFLLERPLSGGQQEDFERALFDRWAAMVAKVMGPDFRPVPGVGVVLRPVKDAADYIAKAGLGCELSSPGTKHGRGDHRTPQQILRDLTLQDERGQRMDRRDVGLWREADDALFGRHALHLTPKARKLTESQQLGFELDELDSGADYRKRDVTVLTITGSVWDTFAHTRLLAVGMPVLLWHLQNHDVPAAQSVVDKMLTLSLGTDVPESFRRDTNKAVGMGFAEGARALGRELDEAAYREGRPTPDRLRWAESGARARKLLETQRRAGIEARQLRGRRLVERMKSWLREQAERHPQLEVFA